MNFPHVTASAIKTAMFNEHQRLQDATSPEFIMPSLFAVGIDKLIEHGYTITPPDADKPPAVTISLAQVKGHHSQMVKAMTHAKEGEVTLSAHHAQSITLLLGSVIELLRTLPRRRK